MSDSNFNYLSTVILAGGTSSRMGTDKALIEIEGIPLIQRTIQIAQSLTPQVYVVTSTPEKYQPYLNGCEVVRELEPQGALVGFASSLAVIKTDWVLLLACDLPKLKLEPLREWSSRLPEIPPDAIAYLSHHLQGWEPLCGFYRRAILSDLQAYMAGGGRSFQKWLDKNQIIQINPDYSEIFFNCNTPADLNSLNESTR